MPALDTDPVAQTPSAAPAAARRLNERARAAEEVRARAEPIVRWLLEDERRLGARTTMLIDRFARRLVEAGLPLERVSVHIQQLHPQLAARGFLWEAEAGGAVEMGFEHSARNRTGYLASPVRLIFEGGGPTRRRLADPACPRDFPILRDLEERGVTDYAIHPMPFSGGASNAISIATRHRAGFDDLHIGVLDEVLPAFSAVLELQQQRRTARELLSTYVGPHTGERILNGSVRPGDGEIIHAVIWICDLRGFTALSESRPLADVIALLNEYFDRIAKAVGAQGGEILKFVGDSILAIFPCDPNYSTGCPAAGAAIDAAEAALAGVAALAAERNSRGQVPLHCGVAIHIGEVMYGNVGAADRLDFTVVGPAVNLASRMEQLCAQLERPIVVSAEVARVSNRRFESTGYHVLKGIAESKEVFALVEEREAP